MLAFAVLVPNAQVLGTGQFPAPAAQTWSAVAKALGQGLSSLEPVKPWLILAGGVVGAVLTDRCGAGVLGQRQQHSQDARRELADTQLVALDNALTARGLEAAAELVGRAGRRKRPHHGAIINSLRAKIGALKDGGPTAQLTRELRLQRTKGRLRVGFAAARRNLHDIPADRSIRRGCRWGDTHSLLSWLRLRLRSLRGTRPEIIAPIGIGACGPERGATDQRERGDKTASPALARRVVMQLLIVPTHGAGVVVRTLVRGPCSAHGLREVLLIPIEPLSGDLRSVMITAVRMLFVPIVRVPIVRVPIVRRACLVGTEPEKVCVTRRKLIKRRAQATNCLPGSRGRLPARSRR